jgi:hypothetical protein
MRISSKLFLTAALAACVALFVLPGSTAAAVPMLIGTASCSSLVESGSHWAQAACLHWNTADGQIHGWTELSFETGFNRNNVKDPHGCEVDATLVSSYGTQNTATPIDCTYYAKQGGYFDTVPLSTWNFGPGRQTGDTYWLHACMTVWTNTATYTSCLDPSLHPVSPSVVKP